MTSMASSSPSAIWVPPRFRQPMLSSASQLNSDASFGYFGAAAYPSAIQTQDGRIHIVYTSGKREQIDHNSFEEQAVLKYKQ